MGATAVAVFASTAWVDAQAPQGGAAAGAPAAQGAPAQGAPEGRQGGGRGGGRQAGPPPPTPRLADGTVNFGRVPGEKGTWSVPYITNMAMRVVTGSGSDQLVPEFVALQAAQAA